MVRFKVAYFTTFLDWWWSLFLISFCPFKNSSSHHHKNLTYSQLLESVAEQYRKSLIYSKQHQWQLLQQIARLQYKVKYSSYYIITNLTLKKTYAAVKRIATICSLYYAIIIRTTIPKIYPFLFSFLSFCYDGKTSPL